MAKPKETSIVGALQERDIGDYARFFEKNRLEELTIEEKGLRITLKKAKAPVAVAPSTVALGPAPTAASASSVASDAAVEKKSNYKEIKSPIVGTFYTASAPGAAAYVKVGDTVQADSKVCIVEAMKIMNEITAGVGGKIVEILVTNGQAVTAQQVLMYVE